MKKFSALEKNLDVKFKNQDLLKQALVHRSYINENPGFRLPHNERLEFLGDAVLELIVTENLFNHYNNPEGEMTNWRSSLVNSKILAIVSRDLGVEDFLYLSKGETRDTGKAREYILGNAFEAITGAIYLDQGYAVTRRFIKNKLLTHLPKILAEKLYIDPKSHFQELTQEKEGVTPEYKVLEERGPDHAKHFEVGVYVGKMMMGKGKGTSKQLAQVEAAKDALERYKK
ncbi:MAG: ribonuclease III [Patescibacteria group bacterium]|nr:ribonuclease III [Patescibacteria group bacterium]